MSKKVYAAGDVSINEHLNAPRLSVANTTSRPIGINSASHNGPYLLATSQNYSNKDLWFALRCLLLHKLWCLGVNISNQYVISHGNSKSNVHSNADTTISGKLHVQNNDSFETNRYLKTQAEHIVAYVRILEGVWCSWANICWRWSNGGSNQHEPYNAI